MCENSAYSYSDGEVVWVKLGSCWWPGEVVGFDKLPPDVLPSLRKPPIAAVKFFQEDAYEFVKNESSIYKYECSRKNEFITKGLNLYRTKHGPMEKFPEDIVRAETAIGGDAEILTRDEFQEKKRESYAGIFGDPAKRTPGSNKKGKGVKGKPTESPRNPMRKNFEKVDYKVHILVQGSKTPNCETLSETSEITATPSASLTQESENHGDEHQITKEPEKPDQTESLLQSTPVASSSGSYSCHACAFTTTRLNVLILHNKTHSVSFMPYTPSPVRKKIPAKLSSKSTSEATKPIKVRKPRKQKTEKEPKKLHPPIKKRAVEEQTNNMNTKKVKTDEEIKSSLLADWDDGDEEYNDESLAMIMAGSPEVPQAAVSPAVPTSAELASTQFTRELSSPTEKEKKSDNSPLSEKAEASSDSKYEFCEDEDWPLEADVGRKIPRVKNPKRKEDTKSMSLDDDEMAREVAELLNKTTVPELPTAPEPLKVEENFPEPSIVKSPDKEKSPDKSSGKPVEIQTKTIFKTKTFFRSRHSRSQDAIGKYVAEQLNAVERMDIAESDINGMEVVSSPETRDSPPIEQIKVTRLAPKIQLKKMKLEAAQLREKEKNNLEHFNDFDLNPYNELVASNIVKDNHTVIQDVLYPTQEIKPVNVDITDQIKSTVDKLKIDNDIKALKESPKETSDVIEEPAKCLIQEADAKDIKKIGKCEVVKEMERKESIHERFEVGQEIENIDDSNNREIQSFDKKSQGNHIQETKLDKTIEEPVVNKAIETVLPNIIQDSESNVVKSMNEMETESVHIAQLPDNKIHRDCEETMKQYMNESTASAVDALLSVSRETDRVTRIISDDPPEDLFEDDNKDSSGICNDLNEENKMNIENGLCHDTFAIPRESAKHEENTSDNKINELVTGDNSSDNIIDNILECNKVTKVPDNVSARVIDTSPSESDLQIAETLINLPSTAIQNNVSSEHQTDEVSVSNESSQAEPVHTTEETPFFVNNEVSLESQEIITPKSKSLLISNNENSVRYETEQEKSENLNAAQSLVQMSESVDLKINIDHNLGNTLNNNKDLNIPDSGAKPNNGYDTICKPEHKIAAMISDNNTDNTHDKNVKVDTSSSKLLKILEEPCTPKFSKSALIKQTVMTGTEKILNFDVAKSSLKGKSDSPKQKIIIRRTTPSKNTIHNITDITKPEKIILSRSKNPALDGSVQTYSIQTTPDPPSDNNTLIHQQKVRKITKPSVKLQKIKPQNSLVVPVVETKTIKEVNSTTTTDDTMFDINSMPIVLSEDLLTPESIEKMPIVMPDGNIITHRANPPKLVKTKLHIENEKVAISATPNKPEVKTLLMNPVSEVAKVTTPNILSKSSKLRAAKPMLVIDRTTGKQKIIMSKGESTVKDIKQSPTIIQNVPQSTSKPEKFIILPTPSSPRPGRTQKIVIDPQTGKAHVLLAKGSETQPNPTDNKSVSAKLIPSSTETNTTGNTVMIITNAQGAQSRIVLTPEHEKMLFPKKQQPNVSQLKTIAHRISTNPGATSKTVVTSIAPAITQNVPAKTQTRIVPKQKSAIITSKGQLIVGGRVATTAQNIAPMPEIKPVPKRIIATEPKKLVQAIQKASSEPLIFLQQKSGAVMQLTTAQFEHLQRTGQIVHRAPAPVQEKIIMQKAMSVPVNEPILTTTHKPRARRNVAESPAPLKKSKHEIAIAPLPTISPLSNTVATSIVPSISNIVSITTTSTFSELENFEELLPSTAIARQQEPIVTPVASPVVEQQIQVPAPAPSTISDGQLIAVPGEHFGGPPGSFYLCMEDNGTFTPIDHRPLVLDNNQLVPMPEPLPVIGAQPERRDILEAALANSDVFHADTTREETPVFRNVNPNISVSCHLSETSTTLNQAPIMTPVEVPTKVDTEPTVPSNIEDGLAVIGVTPHMVPTSLELPITITDPRIAPKTVNPLSNTSAYGTVGLLQSPNTEMTFVTTEETNVPIGGPISMPLLTDDESVGKSMPILTDDVAERTVSSVDSTIGSPSSVRESENEDSGQWTRRLLTPGSDTSEASAEIPLQPAIQLSVNELSRQS